MAALADLKPNCSVRGVLPDGMVTVVSVQWFGSEAIELTYRESTGKVGNEQLYRDREADLEIVEEGRLDYQKNCDSAFSPIFRDF